MNASSSRPPAGPAGDADRHLQQELRHHVSRCARAGACWRDSSATSRAMPTGSFAPDFALQEHAAATADLAAAEHREHHGRVGRRQRGAEQERGTPAEGEQHVRGDRHRRGGDQRARDADPGRRHGSGPEPPPAHPQPPSNKMTASATVTHVLNSSDRHPPELREDIGCQRRADQEERRRRHPQPLAGLAGQHRRDPASAAISTARPNDCMPPITVLRDTRAPSQPRTRPRERAPGPVTSSLRHNVAVRPRTCLVRHPHGDGDRGHAAAAAPGGGRHCPERPRPRAEYRPADLTLIPGGMEDSR